jgi:hypothetical protein
MHHGTARTFALCFFVIEQTRAAQTVVGHQVECEAMNQTAVKISEGQVKGIYRTRRAIARPHKSTG